MSCSNGECRALFASKIIRTGDCILRVPYNVVNNVNVALRQTFLLNLFIKLHFRVVSWFWLLQQLAPDNLDPEIRTLLTDEIGHVAKLAVVVILEMKLGRITLVFLTCITLLFPCFYNEIVILLCGAL